MKTEDTLRESWEEFFHRPKHFTLGQGLTPKEIADFWLSKRREEMEELVKGLESMKPVGEVVSHNTYNDGQRDLINQIIIHLRGTI